MIDRQALIQRISAYLTDDEPGYEFTHWTEEDLTTYFDLALKVLTIAVPELARGTCTFNASSGSVTELPECCENFLGIVSVRVDGQTLPYQPRRVTARANRYAACTTPAKHNTLRPDGRSRYQMDSWSYDPQEGGNVYITPPVPEDASVEITARCVKALTVTDGQVSIPSRYETILFELMLYYAWGVDIESPASRDRSATHYKVAMDLMGLSSNHTFLTTYTRIPEALVKRSSK